MNPMDFGLRDWLLILGPLFIMAVLLHGYWKMRTSRNTLKMALDKSFMSDLNGKKDGRDELALLRAELPTGGARIVKPSQRSNADAETFEQKTENSANLSPSIDELNLQEQDADNSVPVLMEAVELGEPDQGQAQIKSASSKTSTSKQEKIIVFNLIASAGTINGQTLLESLVSQNMMFGDMNIFHFRDDADQVVFSLVNAVEPGSFDLNSIKELETPGVTLFMKVHEQEDPDQAFDEMIQVTRALAEELDCQMKDETHSVVTAQTIEHYRQTIRDYRHKH